MTTFYKIDGIPFEDYFIRKELFAHGGLWTWGSNFYGQLGNDTIVNKSSPVQTVAEGTDWKSVGAGSYHTAAIKTGGTLWTWGHNTYGQLGDDTVAHKSSPVQTVAGGTNWKQVSCGSNHTAAIKTNGELWLWGSNQFYGQLGDNTVAHRSSPVQTVAGGTNWKQVSCGGWHTAAIKTDGALWIWGYNSYGQLGDDAFTHRSSPVQTIAEGTNWKSISTGSEHTVSIKTDGTLWTWGSNRSGQLGDDTRTHRSSPVQTVAGGTDWKQVSCGSDHTAAIKTDGTLWLWGHNYYGQLGDNTRTHRSSPVQTVAGGTNWKSVGAGSEHTVSIKTDGTLWAWGHNASGQLGDNTAANKSSPVQTVAGGTNWKQVNSGDLITIAIRE